MIIGGLLNKAVALLFLFLAPPTAAAGVIIFKSPKPEAHYLLPQTLKKKNEEAAHTPTLQREAGSFLYQPNQTPSSSAISSHEGAFLCEEDV
ncbi:hypothetical protein Pyn_22498 [Prunus yedoensis var. nudiflora]|uniref:Uncharacterized protein n=1 Tax=Prunus yedoensis var. nudiflora TaxID=2094558 RepID=A0A314Z6I2_PRUYE|nr:hypothetical protein Pyn_22498 [Prunus yedoensis var. nudiflora]